MSRWGIGQRLFTGIGALAVLLLLSGGVAIWAGSHMKRQLDHTARETARNLNLARQVERDAVVLDAEQRRLVLSGLGGDQAGLAQARRAMQETLKGSTSRLAEMGRLLREGEARHATVITDTLQQWDASNSKVDQLIGAGDASAAWDVARTTSGPLLDSVREAAARLVKMEEQAFEESVQAGEASYTLMRMLLVGLVIVSIPMVLGVAFSVRGITRTLRQVTRELGDGAHQVAAAAGQVAGASQELSHGASEQAASLEETSAAMVQMTSVTRKAAESSQSVADMTSDAAKLITVAHGALDGMVASMTAIRESSDKVARIIKTIDEIAFQTNILALNAAVEAARAGEAGMGFAVVADEVRNLAQRSAQAAKDTAGLIEESIARANDGERRVGEVSAAVTAVSSNAARIKNLIEEVSVSSREQIQGIDQVTHAVSQMEKVTQSTAANAEENAAVGVELSAQAEAALTSVSRLSVLIEGGEGPAYFEARPERAETRAVSRKLVAVARRRTMEETRPDEADQGASDATGTYGPF